MYRGSTTPSRQSKGSSGINSKRLALKSCHCQRMFNLYYFDYMTFTVDLQSAYERITKGMNCLRIHAMASGHHRQTTFKTRNFDRSQ